MPSNNISRIKSGVIWSAIDKVASSGIQLILNLILARLILPEEFALVAMISIIIAIGQTFIDSGFSQSLIHRQNRTESDFTTVFVFNIVVASLLYALIYVSAPLVSTFYSNQIFTPLTRLVSLNLVISSFSIVQRAVLTIRTDFKTQAIVSLIAILCSGFVGIYMTYKGYGVWSLVAQTLSYQLIAAMLLWLIVKWRPKAKVSKESFNIMFSYGSKLLVSRLINTICQNCHSLIIGKYYTRSNVAYFTNANQISLYSACYLNEIILRALFPIQCEMQNDIEKSVRFFYKMTSLSCFIIFPLMATIIVLSEPFVMTILTPEWIGMVHLMQIIAFSYMWYPLMSSNQMFNVLGRTDLYLKNEIIKKFFFVIITVVTLTISVEALCWGIAFYNFIEISITLYILKKVFPISISDLLKSIFPSLCVALATSIIVYFSCMMLDSNVTRLLLGTVLAIFTYVLISLAIKSDDLKDLLNVVKNKI